MHESSPNPRERHGHPSPHPPTDQASGLDQWVWSADSPPAADQRTARQCADNLLAAAVVALPVLLMLGLGVAAGAGARWANWTGGGLLLATMLFVLVRTVWEINRQALCADGTASYAPLARLLLLLAALGNGAGYLIGWWLLS